VTRCGTCGAVWIHFTEGQSFRMQVAQALGFDTFRLAG
jgi:hypothetical protein